MPHQVAKLDSRGVIISVEECGEEDWKTDKQKRTVLLPHTHDMGDKLKCYKYNFDLNRFEPIIVMGQSGPQAMELTDAIIEAITLIANYTETPLSPELWDALGKGKKDK